MLLLARGEFTIRNLLTERLIGLKVPIKVRADLQQQVKRHATKNNLTSRAQVSPIRRLQVVVLRIFGPNGINICGARHVEIDKLDPGRLCRHQRLVTPLLEVLDDLAIVKGASGEGGDEDLMRVWISNVRHT